MQATSGAKRVPSWAEFEAGASGFHDRESGGAELSEGGKLETLEPAVSLPGPGNPFANRGPLPLTAVSISSGDVKGKGKWSMVAEDVGVALTFLGGGVEGTSVAEIEAVWALLDMKGVEITEGEIEAYLRVVGRLA